MRTQISRLMEEKNDLAREVINLKSKLAERMVNIDHVQVLDGEWVEPTPQKGHSMACCDCGLVHTMNFRIVKGKVQFQAFRNDKATKYRRKKLLTQKL